MGAINLILGEEGSAWMGVWGVSSVCNQKGDQEGPIMRCSKNSPYAPCALPRDFLCFVSTRFHFNVIEIHEVDYLFYH